ncbi:MAG: Copper binding protein plastocyanin/azurin family [Actinomycetota bacterium]|nr:Copper binding protein plastocyanin/azurin family [Actinomycetota bacterium]
MRVFVAVGVFAAGGLAWTDLVAAASHDINVTNDAAKCDKTWGPPCFTPANGTVTQVAVGDTVTWHVLDGTHTVSPVDPAAFTGSGDLAGPDATFNVTFDKPGVFSFYCKHHGSVDKDGKTFHGMWGKIDVRGDTTSTSAPPAPGDPPAPGNPDPGPPPAPGPSKPAPPPPPGSGSAPPPSASGGSGSSGNGQTAAGTGRPYVGPPPTAPPPAPAPRESASAAPRPSPSPSSAPGKGKDGGGGNDSTPGATAVPPDEAVLPPSPAFPTPTTAPVASAPAEAPQGDTVAVLKAEAGGKHRRIILFGTIFGVGAFVFGVGGWKYTHRASKYWPA